MFKRAVTLALCCFLLMSCNCGKADGVYLGLGYGTFKPNINEKYISGIQTIDDASKDVGQFAFGYTWDDWAFEAGYVSFGTFGYRQFKPSEGTINARIDASSFYLAGKRYFGGFYGLLGVHKWYTDAEISRSIAGPNNQHISGTDGMAGVGYEFGLLDHVSMQLSYTKFMGIGNENAIGSKTDAGVVGLSFILQ